MNRAEECTVTPTRRPTGRRRPPDARSRAPDADAIDVTAAVAVADSVLYEGYLLYPYRRSSPKNRVRWQFGVLAPRAWIEARSSGPDGVAGSAESWWNRTECLVEAPLDARLEARLR